MRQKINLLVLRWVLRRMLGTDGWVNYQLILVLQNTHKTLSELYPEDNHATTTEFMKEALIDASNLQKP